MRVVKKHRKMKVNKGLLPVKAHYFFFFAALGPLLPQMNVFGRQLGVSPGVMGLVTAVLPLLWAIAKPAFGYLVDYFASLRKLIFMSIIALMTGSYCLLWFLPAPAQLDLLSSSHTVLDSIYYLNGTVYLKHITNQSDAEANISTILEFKKYYLLDEYSCHWDCLDNEKRFRIWLSDSKYVSTMYIESAISNGTCYEMNMLLNDIRNDEVVCTPKTDCNLLCLRDEIIDDDNDGNVSLLNASYHENNSDTNNLRHDLSGKTEEEGDSFYGSATFWLFVLFMCVGTVAFNVANCISDAVCFDVLGPQRGEMYGAQRAWGTVGYGGTALLGGWLVDRASSGRWKDFTPAFLLALAFTLLDLLSCWRLNLPSLRGPAGGAAELRAVLRSPRVLVFIGFAIVVGTLDSFIVYYMFWYLEELAEQTGHSHNIKLLEGVIVAAQSFVGELLFFFLSGRILKRWGHGTTLTFALFCYGVRLAVISFTMNPWHLVPVEAIMQGPTYALCYATIVGYAAEVAPEGCSATVQGIVAGMDDGVGFALGSLLGGLLYGYAGGASAFRVMALLGVLAAFAHALLQRVLPALSAPPAPRLAGEKLSLASPEAEKMLGVPADAVYQLTTLPLDGAR